jgi:hypothetical protein
MANRSAKQALAGSTEIILNYDSADAAGYDPSYFHFNPELMNAHYSYPKDTVGGNSDLIQSVSVAFDSLVDPYNGNAAYTASSITIDTLIIPIVHVNKSGKNDTLDVQVNTVDQYGYPTTTVSKDIKIISKTLGVANSGDSLDFLTVPVNYTVVSGSKFAVTLVYKGNKKDSCWFLYGFPYFSGNCSGGGPYDLANPTTYSTIDSGKYAVVAANATSPTVGNSFTQLAQYTADGLLPQFLLYFDCNNDTAFEAGTDGASYYQDINIYALVSMPILTGVNALQANGFSVAQNRPNPFNNATQITYNIAQSSDVIFTVCDITGRELVRNTYGNTTPGQHLITLNANQFTPGIYFYSFNVNGNVVTKKMIITE